MGHFELQGGWYTPTLIACCGILRLRLQELYAPHLVAARADWPPAKPFTNLSTKRQQKVPRDVHGLRSCEKSSVYLCLSSKLTCTRMLNKEKQMHAHLRSHISVYLFMLLSCKMTGLEDSVCCPLRSYERRTVSSRKAILLPRVEMDALVHISDGYVIGSLRTRQAL